MNFLKLRLVTYNSFLLQKFLKTLLNELKLKNCHFSVIALPIRSKLFTVIKSPFVNKKAKEQFKIETFGRLVLLKKFDFVEVIQVLKKISHEGIAFKITLKGR